MGRIKEIISIDFGSTNSQMARKYIDLDNGDRSIDWNEKNLTSNLISDSAGSKNIPTVILNWTGKGERPQTWPSDQPAGNDVEYLLKSEFGDNVEVIREFKRDLFYTDEEKNSDPAKMEKYKAACENLKIFLKYLKNIMETNVAGKYEPEESQVYITVPVRSKNSDFETIRKIAEEAGWKNIEILDEAKSALDFAMFKTDSELMAGIKKLTVNQSLHALLIDIGGSTTDIVHVVVSPDGTGGYKSDYKTQWPPIGTTDTLGCIEIDKAIVDFFLKEEYLLKDLVEEEIKKTGYNTFTKYKEKWSNVAKQNSLIPDLKDLSNFMMDFPRMADKGIKYGKLNNSKKLGRKEFQRLINGYIEKLQNAIREVLSRDGIKESELDYVILTGGGSEMYGIEDMILGKLGVKNPLDLKKIKENPKACIHGCQQNPSAACCLGSLLDKTAITCINHINGKYFCEVEVYTANAEVIYNYGLGKLQTGKPDLPEGANHEFTFRFDIAEDLEPLPKHGTSKFDKNVIISSGENLLFRITIYRQNPDSESPCIECSWVYKSERSLFKTLGNFWTEKYKEIKLKNEIEISISENRQISVKPTFSAPGYNSSYANAKEVTI